MFPADCLPANYCEVREIEARKMAAAAKETKLQPQILVHPKPQRPAGPPRTLSSAFLGSFFPSAAPSQASSATTSPSPTPMPSPGLHGPAKQAWFSTRPVPKAEEMDIRCLPPAWS